MALADGEIERVRAATDIVAIISERTALKRAGTRWSGLCPFHTERSPSFSVNAVDGIYYCFGCHAKGDAITFVRETSTLVPLDSNESSFSTLWSAPLPGTTSNSSNHPTPVWLVTTCAHVAMTVTPFDSSSSDGRRMSGTPSVRR